MPTCNVCERHEAKGVAASQLGPASFAYCQQCLDNNAEPAFMLEATHEGCEGNVADWVQKITTYIEGKYIGYNEFVSRLKDRKEV